MSNSGQFRFQKLSVWQNARALSGEIYAVTKTFPRDEQFGLTSQLRRAAVSISTNIAEGSGRNSDPDFAHFLEIAYGSTMEVASLLFLATDANLIDLATRDRLLALSSEVSAQLAALNRSLNVSKSKTPFSRRGTD
ncbi:MAG: four helix bundle protein [Synoicihabitans sp.]